MADVKKPWYKKFKLMVTLATIIIEIAVAVLGEKLSPEYISLMQYIFAISIALITGHTVTDTLTAVKKK